MFPQQQATCTRGPSFPKLKPEATAKTKVTVLIINVHLPRYPLMMKPLNMVLIWKKRKVHAKEMLLKISILFRMHGSILVFCNS